MCNNHTTASAKGPQHLSNDLGTPSICITTDRDSLMQITLNRWGRSEDLHFHLLLFSQSFVNIKSSNKEDMICLCVFSVRGDLWRNFSACLRISWVYNAINCLTSWLLIYHFTTGYLSCFHQSTTNFDKNIYTFVICLKIHFLKICLYFCLSPSLINQYHIVPFLLEHKCIKRSYYLLFALYMCLIILCHLYILLCKNRTVYPTEQS